MPLKCWVVCHHHLASVWIFMWGLGASGDTSGTLTVLLALRHKLHVLPRRQLQQEVHSFLPGQVLEWHAIHLPGKRDTGDGVGLAPEPLPPQCLCDWISPTAECHTDPGRSQA